MSQKIKVKSPTRRNSSALAGHHRHSGPMKDRRYPRGGTRNTQRELLNDQDEEILEDELYEDEDTKTIEESEKDQDANK